MAKFTRSLAALLPLLAVSVNAQLNDLAKAAGLLYFGTATDNSEISDTEYLEILSDSSEFGAITPGNSMKWDATEPTQGTFTFDNGDVIAELAASNGQLLRGHTTVWYSQLPSWVSSGGFDNATLLDIVATHTSTEIEHYAGQAYAWDVVNEPIADDGTWRESVFYTTTGTSFITTALEAARAADPDTKLYINEYNLEYAGAKYNTFLSLITDLVNAGVPLDGVGLQGHLIVGSTPAQSTLETVLESFTALGLEVAFTELDIRLTLPATEESLAQQAADYSAVVGACVAVDGCIGISIWDYTDKYSWIPSVFDGQGAALPWDENYETKPAYDAIVAALSA